MPSARRPSWKAWKQPSTRSPHRRRPSNTDRATSSAGRFRLARNPSRCAWTGFPRRVRRLVRTDPRNRTNDRETGCPTTTIPIMDDHAYPAAVIGTIVNPAGLTLAKVVPASRVRNFADPGLGASSTWHGFAIDRAGIAFTDAISVIGDERLRIDLHALRSIDDGLGWAPASFFDQDGTRYRPARGEH